MYPHRSNTGVHTSEARQCPRGHSALLKHPKPRRISKPEDVTHSLACDYISVTGIDSSSLGSLHHRATQIFRVEADRGNRVRPWGMSGFRGWRCGSVEIGTLDHKVLVRVAGALANDSWTTLFEVSQNCSRLDLQTTVIVKDGVQKRIERCRRIAERFSSAHNDTLRVRWVREHAGGYTLYLGSRKSNCFGRVYDKWEKEKLDHYRDCVRFEVQYQDDLANHVARTLYGNTPRWPSIASHVRAFFRNRGLDLELYYDERLTSRSPRGRSDAEKTLAWLAAGVKPSVERLIALGYESEVFAALGLLVQLESGEGAPSVDHLHEEE